MAHQYRCSWAPLYAGAALFFLTSCNYNASTVDRQVSPPIVVPRNDSQSASLDRLIKNTYQLTASADEETHSPPEKNGIDSTVVSAGNNEETVVDAHAVEKIKKIIPGYSPRFEILVNQSFKRIKLETNNPFPLMDAVALAVQFNRDVKTSYTRYQQALGNLEMARGQFDPAAELEWNVAPSYNYYGQAVMLTQKVDNATYSIGFSSLARSGLQTKATFSLTDQQLSPNYGYNRLGQGNAALVFTMPLLKGFGAVSTDAQEKARMLGLEASAAAVVHQINASLQAAVENYWNYSAAVQNLILSIEAMERSRVTLNDATILVENNLQEPSTLHTLSADLSSKESALQNSEQQVVVARNALAVSLGFPVAVANRLPMPTSEFPEFAEEKVCLVKGNLPLLLKTALSSRQDYRQAELQMKSARIMEDKYRRDVLPNVDLVAGLTHTGFTEESALASKLETASDGDSAITAGVKVALPWTNDSARGQLRNQMGQTEELRFAYVSAKESIASEINNNASALSYAVGILNTQKQAEQQYRQATEDELKKFHLGLSSIIDVLDVADRFNTARSNTVTARAKLATAIANLRYSTGTLLNDKEQGNTLFVENFTVPLPPALFTALAEQGACR